MSEGKLQAGHTKPKKRDLAKADLDSPVPCKSQTRSQRRRQQSRETKTGCVRSSSDAVRPRSSVVQDPPSDPGPVECGSFPVGRITAVPARSANAFAFAVENVADPEFSVAAGTSASAPQVTRDAPASNNRAAPARTCKFPSLSVSRLSPLKIVVPTEAAALPTCARCADTTVPEFTAAARAGSGVAAVAGATQTGVMLRPTESTIAKFNRKRSRRRAIKSPRGLVESILAALPLVNL